MILEKGAVVTASIERLGIHGEGVGSIEGFTLFVEGALPQEVVEVEIYEKRKSFARGKVRKWKSFSKDRVEPVCSLFGRCGGCQIMHLSYPEQLVFKRQRVKDALERVGKFLNPAVHDCRPSPASFYYRNKIQLPFKEGKFGLYAADSHDLVPIEECFIHCPLGESVFKTILHWHEEHPLSSTVRHLLIRTAIHTCEVLVIFVTDRPDVPELILLAKHLLAKNPEVKGVVQNINLSGTNTILGREFRTLVGEGWIHEEICALRFKVSPASFFQVNPSQAEALYRQVLEFAALEKNDRVLDAYCGVGTLALILSKRAKEVVGVECVPAAIDDAKENASLNQINNVQFVCAAAEEFILSVEQIDVAILNPPRKGCEMRLLERLGFLRPRTIVYVSCDPATLARDLSYLCSIGYKLDQVQPFDMFPQTAHVECVTRLISTSAFVN